MCVGVVLSAYISSWYTMYPTYAYYNMYPFGTTYCDTNATSSGKSIGFNPNINFKIPFYGSTWQSIWVRCYSALHTGALNDKRFLQNARKNSIQIFIPRAKTEISKVYESKFCEKLMKLGDTSQCLFSCWFVFTTPWPINRLHLSAVLNEC